MRHALIIIAALFAGTALGAEQPAAAEPENVKLSFTKPKDFRDATYDNRPNSRKDVMRDLEAIFVELGRKYLPPQQRLEIEVIDVDLAGRYEPWQIETPNTRYLRSGTWPSMRLKYRLLEGEREIAQGEDQLADMNYQSRAAAGVRSGDRLRYEKIMLNDWFRNRFGGETAAPAKTP